MKLTFILILMSGSLLAETFKISGSLQYFALNEGLLVQGCEKGCEALGIVKKNRSIDLKSLRAGKRFPGSIGVDTCTLFYKGSIVFGVNKDMDQRTFCSFKDGSLIETNSLSAYLTGNKIVKP